MASGVARRFSQQLTASTISTSIPTSRTAKPISCTTATSATDLSSLVRVIQQSQPDELYNLGAQSHGYPVRGAGIHRDALGALRLSKMPVEVA